MHMCVVINENVVEDNGEELSSVVPTRDGPHILKRSFSRRVLNKHKKHLRPNCFTLSMLTWAIMVCSAQQIAPTIEADGANLIATVRADTYALVKHSRHKSATLCY